MARLVRGGLGLALVSFAMLAFGKIVSVLTRLLLVKMVSEAEFGLFSVAIALLTLTSMLATAGMPLGIVRFFPLLENRPRPAAALRGLIVWPGLVCLAAGSIVAVLLAAVRAAGWYDAAPGTSDRVFLLTVAAIPGQALIMLLTWGILAQDRPTRYLLAQHVLFHAGFLGVAAGIFLIAGQTTLETLMLVYAVMTWTAVGVIGALLLQTLHQNGRLGRWSVRIPPREFFGYSVVVLGSSLSYVALSSVDRLVMVACDVPLEHIAWYAAAYTIAAALPAVISLVDAHASPRLAEALTRNDLSAAEKTYHHYSEMALYLASPAIVLLIVFRHQVVNLFPSTYAPAASILAVMLAAEYVQVVTGLTGRMTQLAGRARVDTLMVAGASVLNLLLNLLLIPQYGVFGAIGATLVARMWLHVGEAVLIWRSWKILPWSREHRGRNLLLCGATMLVIGHALVQAIFE